MNVATNRNHARVWNYAQICDSNKVMQRLLFAAVACASLVVPAVAQGSADTSVRSATVSNQQIALLQGATSASLQRQKSDAMNLFQAAQFGLAAAAFKRICMLEPNNGSNHYWLAEACYEQSNFPLASSEFSQAANLDPQLETAHVRYAESILATRNFNQAREAALRAMPAIKDAQLKGRLMSVLRVSSKGMPHGPNTSSHSQFKCESRSSK